MNGNNIQPHFGIRIADRSFAYCYIRKNACSAWKQLFVEESPAGYKPSEWKSQLHFILANHGLRTTAALGAYENRIVVLRDPVDRFVSAFVGLLIVGFATPVPHLRDRIERKLTVDYAHVTFDMFVDAMLAMAARGALDRHFVPQADHLAPVRYSHVVPIDSLHGAMSSFLGAPLADRYFRERVNDNSARVDRHEDKAHAVPIGELHQRFRSTGGLPSKQSFLAPGHAERIREAYRDDAALFVASTAGAGQSG